LAAAQTDGIQPQVVGGEPVQDGEYRFMASLQYDREGTAPRRDHFCGGTLISPIHPRWEPPAGAFAHDVAVLELDRPVRGIAPIRLATTGTDALERPGRRATVTGWGNTIAQPVGPGPGLGLFNGPNRMREAQVPIVSDEECEAVYGEDLSPRLAVCAGRTNLDTCQGDSGGPLFVPVGRGFRQIGVTSFGSGCGEIGFPGVYTQVSALPVGNFIQRVTGGVPVPAG
jgi:secreted trypsin-like serine protease